MADDIKEKILDQGKDWLSKPENQKTVKKYALEFWKWLQKKFARKS